MPNLRRDLMFAEYRLEDPETGRPLSKGKGGKPVIYLFSRDRDRARRINTIKNFKPHYWAGDLQGDEVDIFGRPIRHIFKEIPADVGKERDQFPYHDEADILFWLRGLIDKKILCGYAIENGNIVPCDDMDIPPLRLYYDIEVEAPPEVLPRPRDPQWPIVSFQFSNNYNDNLDIFLLDCQLATGQMLSDFVPKDYSIEVTHKKGSEVLRPKIQFFKHESIMVQKAAEYVDALDPDIPTGWNSQLFDLPYWIERAKRKLRLDVGRLSPFGRVSYHTQRGGKRKVPFIKGRDPVDMLAAYKKWTSGRQPIVKGRPFGLTHDFKVVVEYETGLVYTDYGDRVAEVRREMPLEWVKYVTIDGYALRLLDEMTGLFKHFDRLRRLYGVPTSWSLFNNRLIDTWLLRIREKPLPSKKHRTKVRTKGAVVLLPPVGIHKWVVLLDIKSIYPMLIMIYNLSSETKDPNGEIIVGPMEDGTIIRFKREPEGILPRAVRMTMEEREKLRAQAKVLGKHHPDYEKVKQLETLYKFLACSYFGVTGFENFRLFDEDVKKSILFLGRQALLKCKEAVERAGYEVVYGDTDSLFVKVNSGHPGVGRILERIVSDELLTYALRHGARIQSEVKYEEFFERIIFKPKVLTKKGKTFTFRDLKRQKKKQMEAAKKRYGAITKDGRLIVVGLEPRRSGTASITRKTMLRWLELVLIEQDVNAAIELLRETIKSLPEMPINEIAIPRGVHKAKAEYKFRNPWIAGCEYMTKFYKIRFREDKKPMLIYMIPSRFGMKKEKRTDVICITEDMEDLPPALKKAVDWDTMIGKVLINPFLPLLMAIGLDWQVIESGTKQDNMHMKVKTGRRIRGSTPYIKQETQQFTLGGKPVEKPVPS